ncbi:MAG: acylphosphatase [Phycisphaeraceae bacterium]|nr:acylphosphatase [Phycisphaeraceae bacterium]
MRQRVVYSGRVQGVGFRVTARGVALRHPVSGFVRNEADGSVMLEVQGDHATIELFRHELRTAMHRNIKGEHEASIAEVSGENEFVIRA